MGLFLEDGERYIVREVLLASHHRRTESGIFYDYEKMQKSGCCFAVRYMERTQGRICNYEWNSKKTE